MRKSVESYCFDLKMHLENNGMKYDKRAQRIAETLETRETERFCEAYYEAEVNKDVSLLYQLVSEGDSNGAEVATNVGVADFF